MDAEGYCLPITDAAGVWNPGYQSPASSKTGLSIHPVPAQSRVNPSFLPDSGGQRVVGNSGVEGLGEEGVSIYDTISHGEEEEADLEGKETASGRRVPSLPSTAGSSVQTVSGTRNEVSRAPVGRGGVRDGFAAAAAAAGYWSSLESADDEHVYLELVEDPSSTGQGPAATSTFPDGFFGRIKLGARHIGRKLVGWLPVREKLVPPGQGQGQIGRSPSVRAAPRPPVAARPYACVAVPASVPSEAMALPFYDTNDVSACGTDLDCPPYVPRHKTSPTSPCKPGPSADQVSAARRVPAAKENVYSLA